MTYLSLAVWPKGKKERRRARKKWNSVNFLVACASEFMTIEQSANTAKTKVQQVHQKKKPNKTLGNNNNNSNITWKHLAADLSSNFAFLGLDELGPHLNFCNFLLHTANPCCCWSSTLSCCWCCCCWSIADLCFMSRAGGNRNLGSRKWATVANSKAYCIIISLCVCVCVYVHSTKHMPNVTNTRVYVCLFICIEKWQNYWALHRVFKWTFS